jgi:hypothetical protein
MISLYRYHIIILLIISIENDRYIHIRIHYKMIPLQSKESPSQIDVKPDIESESENISESEDDPVEESESEMSNPKIPIYDTTSELPSGNVMIMRDGIMSSALQFACLSVVSALFGIIAQIRGSGWITGGFVFVSMMSTVIVLVTISAPETIPNVTFRTICKYMNPFAVKVSMAFAFMSIVLGIHCMGFSFI